MQLHLHAVIVFKTVARFKYKNFLFKIKKNPLNFKPENKFFSLEINIYICVYVINHSAEAPFM